MAPQTKIIEGGGEASSAEKRAPLQESEGLLDPRRQSLRKTQEVEFHSLGKPFVYSFSAVCFGCLMVTFLMGIGN